MRSDFFSGSIAIGGLFYLSLHPLNPIWNKVRFPRIPLSQSKIPSYRPKIGQLVISYLHPGRDDVVFWRNEAFRLTVILVVNGNKDHW